MTTRCIYSIGLVLVAVLVAASFYIQFYVGIQPCPLCLLQRVVFCLIGSAFLIGICVATWRYPRQVINSLVVFFSLCGMGLAGRQIWLQNFATTGNDQCGVSLAYMAQVLPWKELIYKVLLENSTECSQRGWEFMSLNMPEWSFIWFSVFLIMGGYAFVHSRRMCSLQRS